MRSVIVLTMLLMLTFCTQAYAQDYPDLGVSVETVHKNLDVPWSVDWLPDGTMLFTERGGNLWVSDNSSPKLILSLETGGIEGGLLGLAVDPNFESNNYIYLYYTYSEFFTLLNKVVRYQYIDNIISDETILLDRIPGGHVHDGGRIQFGPDEKLYITTGDAGISSLSQDVDSLAGKILRINSDGTIPDDNPWTDSPVYSIGHRNPQGIDWDTFGNLIATEHGPSGFESGHDEINIIVRGANYGWPNIIGDESADGMRNPVYHTSQNTWAPSGAEFYDDDAIPLWTGKYFVAALYSRHLHMFDLNATDGTISSHTALFQNEFGRLRDVQTGPDGYLYLLTSNREGRGSPSPDDDRILRILPLDTKCDTNNSKNCMTELRIPKWVKTIFAAYSDGTISEDELINALQYLIEKRVILIDSDSR